MPKKNTTIEDLAVMVKKGFDEVTGSMAQKKDVDERLGRIDNRLGKVEDRLENIEKLLLKQHSFKIQELEKRMKRMEDLFAVK